MLLEECERKRDSGSEVKEEMRELIQTMREEWQRIFREELGKN